MTSNRDDVTDVLLEVTAHLMELSSALIEKVRELDEHLAHAEKHLWEGGAFRSPTRVQGPLRQLTDRNKALADAILRLRNERS
jgi:hypothetical protein